MNTLKLTTKVATFAIVATCGAFALANDDDVKLIYPKPAAAIELDESTPQKRITPPVREESEFDPVTPLGQIKAVKESLDRIESAQEEVKTELKKSSRTLSDDDAFLSKFNALFPLLEKGAADSEKVRTDVEAVQKTASSLSLKIDTLQKTTENLRATVEAAQKTAASIEKIRTSRWTDYAVLAILALVILQIGARLVSFVANLYRASRARIEEQIYERAQQIVNNAKKKTTTSKTKKDATE